MGVDSSGEAPIAAVATASGVGGVAIVRLSGEGVYEIADRLTALRVPPSRRAPGTFVYTRLLGAAGETLDDGLMLFFRAPHSYTGEDVVELCVHGGPVVVQAVLERVWQLGARPAGPGEFTRRAFLNGRMDLTQAEAVADLIAARSPRAERAARANLQGRLGAQLGALYDEAVACSAEVEHSLDFDEEALPEAFFEALGGRLEALAAKSAGILATWHEGRLLREGALVVLAGKPNAGKSTLLNLLLGYERAIVSAEPGTTRDSLEESFVLDGVPLRLTDTAGLREAPGLVERQGVERTRALLERADAVLYLSAVGEAEEAVPAGAYVVRTKADLARSAAEAVGAISATADPAGARAVVCGLLREILGLAGGERPHAMVANERQYAGVAEADEAFHAAVAAFRRGGLGYVPAAQHLRTAAEALGRLLGRVYSDDLLDRVFASFCVGK